MLYDAILTLLSFIITYHTWGNPNRALRKFFVQGLFCLKPYPIWLWLKFGWVWRVCRVGGKGQNPCTDGSKSPTTTQTGHKLLIQEKQSLFCQSLSLALLTQLRRLILTFTYTTQIAWHMRGWYKCLWDSTQINGHTTLVHNVLVMVQLIEFSIVIDFDNSKQTNRNLETTHSLRESTTFSLFFHHFFFFLIFRKRPVTDVFGVHARGRLALCTDGKWFFSHVFTIMSLLCKHKYRADSIFWDLLQLQIAIFLFEKFDRELFFPTSSTLTIKRSVREKLIE